MKRIILIISLLIMSTIVLHTHWDDNMDNQFFDRATEIVAARRIPNEYLETFLYYTRSEEMKALRFHFMAIADIESNWVWMRSFQPNRDGSLDLGPMGLNSNNIKNSDFMNRYAPKDLTHIHNENQLYMVTCMNYFYNLYKNRGLGEDAFYAYNTGIGNYLRGHIPDITRRYRRRSIEGIERYLNQTMDVYTELNLIWSVFEQYALNEMRSVFRGVAIMDPTEIYRDEEAYGGENLRDEILLNLKDTLVENFGETELSDHPVNHLKHYLEAIFEQASESFEYRASDDIEVFLNSPDSGVSLQDQNRFYQLRDVILPNSFRRIFGIKMSRDAISDGCDFDALCILYDWWHTSLRMTFNYFVSNYLIQTNAVDEDFIRERKFDQVHTMIDHEEYEEIIRDDNICTFENVVEARMKLDVDNIDVEKIYNMLEFGDIAFDHEVFTERINKILSVRPVENQQKEA